MTVKFTQVCQMQQLVIQFKIISHSFRSCTVHSGVIQSFISPTNAQPICFKILNFTSKYTINAFIVYFNVNFNI